MRLLNTHNPSRTAASSRLAKAMILAAALAAGAAPNVYAHHDGYRDAYRDAYRHDYGKRAYKAADRLVEAAYKLQARWRKHHDYDDHGYERRVYRRLAKQINRYYETTKRLRNRIADRHSGPAVGNELRELERRGEKIAALMHRADVHRKVRRGWSRTYHAYQRVVETVDGTHVTQPYHGDERDGYRPGHAFGYHNDYDDDRRGGHKPRPRQHDGRNHDGGVNVAAANQVEDLSERVKNEFRAHVRRHGDLKHAHWARRLDGLLSQFDQHANQLQRAANQGYGQNPANALQRQARAIGHLIAERPVGPNTRRLWHRLRDNLYSL